MVLALAVLDAAVGVSLVVDGVRSESAASRYVGTALLVCAAVLGAVPWLTEEPESPVKALAAESHGSRSGP